MLNKKLVLCVTLAGAMGLASSVYASGPGFYLGGQGGYGYPQYDKLNNAGLAEVNALLQPFSTSSSSNNTTRNGGLAGRIYAGYQIDPTWGLEVGYTQFSNAIQKLSYTNNFGGFGSLSYGQKNTIYTSAVDLVAKATLPIENGFSVYGKAGLAYVSVKENQAFSESTTAGIIIEDLPTGVTHTVRENRILPTASIGVEYAISPQLTADLSYTRIQKTGSPKIIRSTNFAGIGLAYHFS